MLAKQEKKKDRRAVILMVAFLAIFFLTNTNLAIGTLLIVVGILVFIAFWGAIISIPIILLGKRKMREEERK